jgi:CDP-glycerol glycerophosphotransferase (TagB/SpsB family)
VLHSERLRLLLDTYNYRLMFYLHRHMQQYLELFEVPSHIQTAKQAELNSIDNLFKRSRVFITDYSSAAFEWGLMRRSVMYYQFDHETFLAGGNASSVPGYFEYERDGFGPVAYDESTLLDYLEQSLRNDGTPSLQYLKRINATFTYHDTSNCKRVFEAAQDMFIPFASSNALCIRQEHVELGQNMLIPLAPNNTMRREA